VDDPLCRELLGRFASAGVGVAVWDATSDLGVPVFFCSIVERELDPFRRVGLARGFGCHPDRTVALSRALCEAAQSRLTRIAGSRDDLQAPSVEDVRSAPAIRHQQAYLDEEELASREFSSVPTRVTATFEQDLSWALERAAEAGLGEIAYVDLSRAEFPVAVVRVLIPGLEGSPDAAGYLPGARARRAAGRPS
jgi:ribosomal protein S12 methylthiotransferase accessory factor